ncbi:hypothetical protein AC482_03310, partial [miscellaneous Crenarchaeota group-15 archaeon DG-45]
MSEKGNAGTRRLHVTFEPVGRRIEAEPGTTILEAAGRAGIAIASDCGGLGICGRCRVIVPDRGACGEPTSAEERLLSPGEAE